MNPDIKSILHTLKKYKETPESRGLELRLNLADIILRHLRLKGWNQRDLAAETRMKEPFVSRVLHSSANCTFETAGRLLFALGVDVRLEEVPGVESFTFISTCGDRKPITVRRAESYGEQFTSKQDSTKAQIPIQSNAG